MHMNLSHEEVLRAVGHNIRMRRTDKRWSIEHLALLLNTSQGHISNIENGKVDMVLSTLLRIIQALDCTISDVFPAELLSKN